MGRVGGGEGEGALNREEGSVGGGVSEMKLRNSRS